VYSGKYQLTQKIEDLEPDAGKLVLSPTRTFAPLIRQVLERHRPDIHGMIHCTGGGQTKVMKFVKDIHVIKDNLFPLPPLFRIIRQSAGTPWDEMYEVYNMGHRFEIYTDEKTAAEIIGLAAQLNIEAKIIGHTEAYVGHKLTIQSEFGSFTY
jgi:phosphoribosylformylglycinamidine cyclo-ligase